MSHASSKPIFDLIDADDLDGFRAAVTSTTETQARDRAGRTVLIACVDAGRLAMAEHALAVGASARERISHPVMDDGQTALRRAIERPRPAMVKLLLAHDAALEPSDTPLAWLMEDAPPIVARALAAGATSVDDPRVEVRRWLEARFELAPVASPGAAAAPPAAESTSPRGTTGREPSRDEIVDAAIDRGDAAALEAALEAGASANAGDETPLHRAVEKADAELVRVLLAHGAKPNKWIEEWSYPAGPFHASPISMAAEGGHLEILRLLLDAVKKPTPAKEKMPGTDPLAISATPQVAELLLSRGAKVTDEAVAAFLRRGWLGVARAAIAAAGKKLGKPLEGERSSFDEALAAHAPLDVLEQLVALGAKPSTSFPDDLDATTSAWLAARGIGPREPSSVWEAAAMRDVEAILRYVERHGEHAAAIAVLAHAGRHEHVARVAEVTPVPSYDQDARKILVLVDAGLAMRLVERWQLPLGSARGARFVQHAIEEGRPDLVRALLAAGAAVVAPPGTEATIHFAARTGRADVLTACIDHVRPTQGLIATWIYACGRVKTPAEARDAMIERLRRESGPATQEELSAIAIAAAHHGVMHALVDAIERDPAATEPKRDEYGVWRSPLHGAVEEGYVDIVRYLLERGADPNTLGRDKLPVLAAALGKERFDVAELLVAAGADPNRSGVGGALPLASASTDEAWTVARRLGCDALYSEA